MINHQQRSCGRVHPGDLRHYRATIYGRFFELDAA